MPHAIDETLVREVPARVAYHYRFLPLDRLHGMLRVLVEDPDDLDILDAIARELRTRVEGVKETPDAIAEGLKRYYGIGAETLEGIIESQDRDATLSEIVAKAESTDLADLAADPSIVKFVNQIIFDAYINRATDIHIEPFEGRVRVRNRIDGVLHEAAVPPEVKRFQDAIISRIKIMADMNIAEKRLPQDGRIGMRVGAEDLDLRVSVLPVPHGESVNLRLLRRGSSFFGLEELGYQSDGLALLERAMSRPHGILLVTGPTGSGKTTTLYACLSRLNTLDRKILTVEDPIEYEMDGICQMQVHPKIGFTFAAGLRSMLRHDPDVMLVGEIRDFETAELAIRAALTGHLVFSTLHTNDAPGAATRLIDLGVESFLVASSLECVVAQRLVRRICEECRAPATPPEVLRTELGVDDAEWKAAAFSAGKGCKQCLDSGFRGRTAIHEIMMLNEELRDLVMRRVSTNQLRRSARDKGMRTLREDGWRRVAARATTPEEIVRVTQGDDA